MPPIIPLQIDRWRATVNLVIGKLNGVLSIEEVFATIKEESFGNQFAVNPNDPSFGLMQVTERIARQFAGIETSPARSSNPLICKQKPSYGYDTTHAVFVPQNNVTAGAGFLAYLKNRYAKDHPLILPSGEINPNSWIAAYNCGEPNLLRGFKDTGYVNSYIANLREFGVSL